MTVEAQNFEMYEGEHKLLRFAVTDTGESSGIPEDLSGISAASWVLARALDSASALVTKTLGSGITIIDVNGTNDGLEVLLTPTDTEATEATSLGAGVYVHLLWIKDSSNQVSVLATGTVKIKDTPFLATA